MLAPPTSTVPSSSASTPTNDEHLHDLDSAGTSSTTIQPQSPCGGIAPTCKLYLDPDNSSHRHETHHPFFYSYISYRQSFTHHPAKKPRYNGFSDPLAPSEESRRLISESGGFDDDGDAIIEMDILPPRWVDVQEEVTELLADIAQKSAELDKLHHKHLLPGFGDEDARKQEEHVIERLTQEVTRGFHQCQKAVQKIEVMVREAKQQGGVSSGDETMAKNIQISLASRVQEASARFRKKQSTYLKSEIIRWVISANCSANTILCRVARTRGLRTVVRPLPHACTEPLYGPFADGIGCG